MSLQTVAMPMSAKATWTAAKKAPGEDVLAGPMVPVKISGECSILDGALEHCKSEREQADEPEYKVIAENMVSRLSVYKAIFQTVGEHTHADSNCQNTTVDEMFALHDKAYEPKDFTYSTDGADNGDFGGAAAIIITTTFLATRP